LRSQGASQEIVDAVGRADLSKAKLTDKERSLLEFVKVLTLTPAQTTDDHVATMRKAGWTDEEIFEAAFEVSAFAFFNRMADAYGLDYPAGGYRPPDEPPGPMEPR
jgi:alkylhydroperoxidase family enzyme